MDDIDQAQQNDEFFRQAALRTHFAGNGITPSERPKPGPCSTETAPGRGRRICRDCGDEIEPGRLEALPYAVRCVECQKKHERRDRTDG